MVAAMLRFPGDRGDIEEADSENHPAIFLDVNPRNFEILLDIARGRPRTPLQYLSPFDREALRLDADYLQMDLFQKEPLYTFRLAQSNTSAMITNDGTVYTVGVVGTNNTVLGDTPVPSSGRHYWEAHVVDRPDDHPIRVGVAEATCGPDNVLGFDDHGWAWRANSGSSYTMHNDRCSQQDVFPKARGQGQVIGVDLDMDRGTFSFWDGGRFIGAVSTGLKGRQLFPAFSVYSTTVIRVISGMVPPDILRSA